MRRRAQVQVLLLGEQNRLEASSETVRASIQRLIVTLRGELASLEKAIAQQVRSTSGAVRSKLAVNRFLPSGLKATSRTVR